MTQFDGKGTADLPGLAIGPADARRTARDLAVAASGIGTFDWDLLTGRLMWDERHIEMFGYQRPAFDQTIEAFYARLHPDDVPRVNALLREAIATGGSFQDEYRVLRPEGGHRWLATRGRALSDEHGTTVRVVGAAWDSVSHGVRTQSELTGPRERLLSRISERLGSTQHAGEAVRRLSRLAVPGIADWCIVTLIDDDQAAGSRRGLRTVASWHADPALRAVAHAYGQAHLSAPNDDPLFIRALRTGQTQVVPRDATEETLSLLSPGPMRDLIPRLAPESLAILPLPGPNGPVGMLTVANGTARGPLTSEQLATAGHVAVRAGLVLANARLYRQQRGLAEGFQRSLLTAPPQSEAVQIVVRYVPAAQAAEVGGDWYDAFVQPNGATALVIGDVVGHDTQAAAAMGQIRSTVRTIGAESHDGPADLLRRVDRVLNTLQTGILATTVLARLEHTGDERSSGVTRLRWSNAGHPPPAMLTTDGRVQLLTAAHTDLLLGVDPDAPRRESLVTLDPDAVLLLYTDGLVERRDQDLDQGLNRLQRTLADLAGLSLDELCDELLTRMVPASPDDDVALLAVRLRPT
ncbi:MAG: Two component sensory transduction histidine kinase with sensory domain [Blastococcus sp.]|jgi:serine phosphatase RsbU (regulator of sigma subunit)|nr:Two component sensory transduction histidine kinase with sensory domain [Blastococcus sp.]